MGFWSENHLKTLLPAFFIMLALSLLLRYLLGGRPERVRMIPFQAAATIIFALEIVKQIRSLIVGYDLYHLPFHFCSVLTLALPIMAFYRGKYKNAVRAVTTMLSASLFLLMTVAPALIYSSNAIKDTFHHFSDFHTTFFHTFTPVTFLLIVALDLFEPRAKRDMTVIPLFMAGFCAIAGTMAQLFKTNFHNFYTCSFGPAEEVRLQLIASLGGEMGQLCYILIFSAVNIVATAFAYWVYRGVRVLLRRFPCRVPREPSENEQIEEAAARILKKHKNAFQELAK